MSIKGVVQAVKSALGRAEARTVAEVTRELGRVVRARRLEPAEAPGVVTWVRRVLLFPLYVAGHVACAAGLVAVVAGVAVVLLGAIALDVSGE